MDQRVNTAALRLLQSVEYCIEDAVLEEQGIEIDMYFDTSQVRAAALGMMAYYHHGFGFDVEQFTQPLALVQCLLARGFLGEFRMLPSHEAEFLNLLEMGFGGEWPQNMRTLAATFQEALQGRRRGSRHMFRTITSLDIGDPAQIEQYVQQQAGMAEMFFKVVECMRGNWKTRVAEWRERRLLVLPGLDGSHLDYTSILSAPSFERVKKSFDLKRPGLLKNNFADAFAVVLGAFEALSGGC
jgi:hypothetical protein